MNVRPCAVEDLAMLAGGWGGATGSMAGGASVVNVSGDRCQVSGRPAIQLVDRRGIVIASGGPAQPGEPVVLPTGGVAGATIVWQNWCGDPPSRPLAIRLSPAPDAPFLESTVDEWENVGADGAMPRCDLEAAPSSIDALPFEASEPPDPGDVRGGACSADDLAAFMGAWGAAAGTSYASVVVVNTSDVGCDVDGAPVPELRAVDGELLARGARWPEARTFDLPSGQAAQAFLGFADWCRPAPKLPFEFDLLIGDARIRIEPTSAHSTIGVPACLSDPATAEPKLFFDGPLVLPEDRPA